MARKSPISTSFTAEDKTGRRRSIQNLTPGQKAARTRAANKAAREAAQTGVDVREPCTPQQTAAKAVSTALAQVSRVVIVNFPGSLQGYAYHTRDDSIAVDDYCLVISPYEDRKGSWNVLGGYLSIVKVVDIKETTHSINAASKWIVSKLDISAAIQAAERRQQLEVLQAKITKARKDAEARVKLEQLRAYSPELSALLDEMDTLQASI